MNLAFWLSIVLAASSCVGLILAGRGKWQGWAVGLATQPVWASYAILTKGYGLLITCAMFTTVYTKNILKWRKDAKYRKQVEDAFAKNIHLGHMSANEARLAYTKPIVLGDGPEVFEIQGLDMSDPKNNALLRDFLEWRKAHSRPGSLLSVKSDKNH